MPRRCFEGTFPHQSARESRAFWKRLAWLLSALASVSNQSATSVKPSSRADFAMPGYMSVYSCVSPATAAFRFSRVRPIGRLVAGRVAGLAFRSGAEEGRHIVLALDVGLGCEVKIAAVGLRFAGECGFQVV